MTASRITLRRSVLVLACAWSFAAVLGPGCQSPRPRLAEPSVLDAGDVRAAVGRIPSYTRLSFEGLGYLDETLFAATNVGVFKVGPRGLEGVDQWHAGPNVVSGGWVDVVRKMLWFFDEENGEFLRRTPQGWERLSPPASRHRQSSRGDVLAGFHLSGGKSGLWIAGHGSLWRRNFEKEEWVPEPDLPGNLIPSRVAALDDGLVVVATSGDRLLGDVQSRVGVNGRSDRIFLQSGNAWKELSAADGPFRAAQTISSADACYIRTQDQRIIEAGPTGVRVIPGPGHCETLAIDPQGQLWGSFPSDGICQLKQSGEWEHRFPHPHAATERWERPSLASNGTSIAYSSCAVAELRGYRMSWVGTPALWRTEGTSWKSITW